jgi:hypothetical protein
VLALRVFIAALLLGGLAAPAAHAAPAQSVRIQASPEPAVRPEDRSGPREGNLPLTLLGAIALLMVLVPARRLFLRTTPGMPGLLMVLVPARRLYLPTTPGIPGFAAHPAQPVPRPGSGPGPCSALSFEEGLSSTTGVGVVGPGAEGFMRAAFVELLTRAERKVILSRTELNRLFEGSLSADLLDALSPRLHVCDLPEDVITYLELRRPGEADRTYWIAAPGADDDAVLPLLRREADHRLRALLFGEWRHGPTTAINADGTVPGHLGLVPTLTPAEAAERLHLYALTDR